jgi:ribosomal protein S12 methylthiotransferase
MAIQSQISWEVNQTRIGQVYRCMIDRVEGGYFVGRTEFDSPDVDNEVLVDASRYYLRLGEFAELRITEASDFDLYGEPATEEK